jgi:hypothetical protein
LISYIDSLFYLLMEKVVGTNLFAIMVAFSLIIIIISLSDVLALDNNDKNVFKKNEAPTIVVLHKIIGIEGQRVTLDASKTFDPDGDPVKFIWRKMSPANFNIDIMNDRSPIAFFIAPSIKSKMAIVVQLSAVDSNGNAASDQLQVILSKKIGGDKLEDQTYTSEPKSKNNVGVTISKNLLSLSKPKQMRPGFSSKGESGASDRIKVSAGTDMKVLGGNIVTLNGKILHHVDLHQIKLSWKQTKGPHVELSSKYILDPYFFAPSVKKREKIVFELNALDQIRTISYSDTLQIVVMPGATKQGQILNKDGQGISPTDIGLGNKTTKKGQQATSSSEQIVTTSSTDVSPPTVVGTTPSNGATGVAISSTITATFSEVVKSITVNPATFIVKTSTGTSIAGTVKLSSDGKTGIFTPSSRLASSTSYTATVRSVRDLAGNTMVTPKIWSFKTASSSGTASNVYDNFGGSTYALKDGMTSPNGKWLDKWNGYGEAGVKTVSGNNIFYQIPKSSTSSSETHSSLVVSTQKFSDFTLDIDMNTFKQLRQNSPPNTWETAWVMWRWVDLYHHYYFVIKTNGFEFGKKDTSCNCEQQVFLKTGTSPKLQIASWNHVKISSIGKHTIIWIGGSKVVDMDDPSYNSAKMSSGFIGLYNEDASVGFDNVYVGK